MIEDNRADYRERLSGDCERCFGLCCIALPFAKSADFAMDKASGSPCKNLRDDHRCGIHTKLRDRGFRGCTVYDCHGAGQHLSQMTYAGRDPRTHPEQAAEMYELLPVMQQLHEMLLYLEEALTLPAAAELEVELRERLAATEAMTRLPGAEVLALDLSAHRASIGPLLLRVSERVREAAPRDNVGHSRDSDGGAARRERRTDSARRRGAGRAGAPAAGQRNGDYIGVHLRGADLRGANLRGALMIAADLRDADLRAADLIGADLRDADLRGTDLTGSVFLTRMQVRSAKGDARTRLPAGLERPSHWV